MRKLLILLGLIIPFVALSAVTYTTRRDILYSKAADSYSQQRCRLDVYYPENVDTVMPVVVWFHGGGLTGGNKAIPEQLKNSGLVVVAPNYRLMPDVEIEECIDDAAAAVAWTFDNVKDYNGDVRKIIVAGHSAGGYLTGMIGLDKHWLEKYGVDADSIAALAPYSGQVITHFAQRRRQGLSELQPTVDSLAPLYHIRRDAPPYIIITGDRNLELYGRYEENAYMWRMMHLTGNENTLIYELDGYNHGDMPAPAHHILKQYIRSAFKNASKK